MKMGEKNDNGVVQQKEEILRHIIDDEKDIIDKYVLQIYRNEMI